MEGDDDKTLANRLRHLVEEMRKVSALLEKRGYRLHARSGPGKGMIDLAYLEVVNISKTVTQTI